MHHLLVVIEKNNGNFIAYSPDLPGCAAFGKTVEQAKQNIDAALTRITRAREAAQLPLPVSRSFGQYFAV